jgi:hypothetical protein
MRRTQFCSNGFEGRAHAAVVQDGVVGSCGAQMCTRETRLSCTTPACTHPLYSRQPAQRQGGAFAQLHSIPARYILENGSEPAEAVEYVNLEETDAFHIWPS